MTGAAFLPTHSKEETHYSLITNSSPIVHADDGEGHVDDGGQQVTLVGGEVKQLQGVVGQGDDHPTAVGQGYHVRHPGQLPNIQL